MVKGILILESGDVQQIGDLNSFAGIIATIKKLLPQLEEQEAQRIIQQISDEDLQRIITARKEAKQLAEK
jgi:hypothetical protein